MSCGNYNTMFELFANAREALQNGQFLDAVTCVFIGSVGGSIFPVLFFIPVSGALYYVTGTVVVPLVLSLIIGSVILTQLPPSVHTFAMVLLFIGISIAPWIVAQVVKRR